MDPPTPVITPGSTPPLATGLPASSPLFLPHSYSLVSVRSMFSLSVCSLPSDSPAMRCPNCREIINLPGDERLAGEPADKRLAVSDMECPPGDAAGSCPSGNLCVDFATQTLLKTVQEAEKDLERICQDLHQIHLMNPSPAPSQTPSFQSLLTLSKEYGASSPSPAQPGSKPSSLHPEGSTHQLPVELSQPHCSGFGSGHPLIADLGDLVNLSQANVRLLKTLQDKVNKVDSVEKLMRVEREALDREKEHLRQLRSEIEVERLRLMDRGLKWGNHGAGPSTFHSAANMSRGGSHDTAGEGEGSLCGDDGEMVSCGGEWCEEKEMQMQRLEEMLRKAQRGWSDEQEEILEPLEKLREEKYRGTKVKRLERQTSAKVVRVRSTDGKVDKSAHKKSLDFATPDGAPRPSIKNPFTNLVRKASVGSIIPRRDSSASTAAPTPKLFKKWF